ncbi:MAG: CBS domain-containing protein [Actinomycetota bacterium]|jgi:CBS domain-containing protein|nr:CBS domain-containing protein [Actinomycetota bacterium]
MIVREALVSDPRVVSAGAGVSEVAELLTHPNVRSALVVDGDRLVGCVTTDAIVAAVASGVDVTSLSARDLADSELTTIGPDAPLDEALRVMVERDLERLPVTEEGRLVGVLPREPLLRRLAEDEPPAIVDQPRG